MNPCILLPSGSLPAIEKAVTEYGQLSEGESRARYQVHVWSLDDGSRLIQLPEDAHAYVLTNLLSWIPFHLREAGEIAPPTEHARQSLAWFRNLHETLCFRERPDLADQITGITETAEQVILYLPENQLSHYPSGTEQYIDPPKLPLRTPDYEFVFELEALKEAFNPQLLEYQDGASHPPIVPAPTASGAKGCLPAILLLIGFAALGLWLI